MPPIRTERRDARRRWRGLVLRLVAMTGAAAVAVVALATETAHDNGRVDEAGIVLIGVCAMGLLLVSWKLWARGGLQFALAGLDLPMPAAPAPAAMTMGPSSTTADEKPVILVEGVTVRYGLRTALNDVSLHVGPGEIVALLGPNGAGKTTTVDVCCGLRKPDAGRASVLGHDSTASGRELRRGIGVMPQETGLYPELTAAEYLRLFAAMYEMKKAEPRIEELLRLMGLWDRRNTRVEGFSGGMKRRLALSRALLHGPPVLFLDEPTLGVDVHGRRALWDHVARLRDEGHSVLLTTNYLEEATALCDRVVILDTGVVLADASPAELRGRSGTTLTLEVPGHAEAVAAAVRDRHGLPVEVDADFVAISLAREDLAAEVIHAAAAYGPVASIRTDQPTLEEVFLRLTGRELRE